MLFFKGFFGKTSHFGKFDRIFRIAQDLLQINGSGATPGPKQQEQRCLCGSGGCSRAMTSGGTRSACGFLFLLVFGCGISHSLYSMLS